jgi:hypothetical protein
MSNPEGQPITTRCKLCAAFTASQLPTTKERKLVGSDSFTRDADICDACLGHDYSTGRRLWSVEDWFALTFGLLTALIAAGVITIVYRHDLRKYLHFVSRLDRPFVSLILITVVLAVPCMSIAWLLIKSVFWQSAWRDRAVIKKERTDNAPTDAKRFYWLAVWASVTGHHRFKRRMLKQAAAIGIADVRHIRKKAYSKTPARECSGHST